jgi:protochlorophyllide reductase
VWSVSTIPDLTGRAVIVTGANVGLGRATTCALASRGAHVVMACRNEEKGHRARRELIGCGIDPRMMTVLPLDLGDQSSIPRFAKAVLAGHDRLDLLVNNAGIAATTYARTVDGYEMQFGVNHLGHMALTLRLLPLVAATPGSRVVTVTSCVHRFGRIGFDDPMFERRRYWAFSAYAQSKLANVLFSAELARRLRDAGHDTVCVACDPGLARTEIGTKQSGRAERAALKVCLLVVPSQSAQRGARCTLRAATDPDVVSGQFYAPRFGAVGPPVVRKPSRRATRDPADAVRLWELSLAILGMDSPTLLEPIGWPNTGHR